MTKQERIAHIQALKAEMEREKNCLDLSVEHGSGLKYSYATGTGRPKRRHVSEFTSMDRASILVRSPRGYARNMDPGLAENMAANGMPEGGRRASIRQKSR